MRVFLVLRLFAYFHPWSCLSPGVTKSALAACVLQAVTRCLRRTRRAHAYDAVVAANFTRARPQMVQLRVKAPGQGAFELRVAYWMVAQVELIRNSTRRRRDSPRGRRPTVVPSPQHTIGAPMTVRMGTGQRRRLLSVLTVVGLLLGSIATTTAPATAIGGYSNAAIADTALNYVNQWGGNACNDAQKPGDSGGQCRAFVNCIVWMASGHSQNLGGSDYYQPFLNAGGVRI